MKVPEWMLRVKEGLKSCVSFLITIFFGGFVFSSMAMGLKIILNFIVSFFLGPYTLMYLGFDTLALGILLSGHIFITSMLVITQLPFLIQFLGAYFDMARIQFDYHYHLLPQM